MFGRYDVHRNRPHLSDHETLLDRMNALADRRPGHQSSEA